MWQRSNRAQWEALIDLVTPDERSLLESQRRRGRNIAAGGLGLLFVAIIVAVVAAATNPTYPALLIYLIVILIFAFSGAGVGWAAMSINRGAYESVRNISRKRRPDMFDPDGSLSHVTVSSSPRRATNRGNSPTIENTRPCPYCGTMNQRDWSFCQKCAKPLPPPL